ncbi:MAG: hypothetical protein H0Z33_15870 [Bacillaceae bacterium]|nr:hypothetical protein [Bacillaceae bacterium]
MRNKTIFIFILFILFPFISNNVCIASNDNIVMRKIIKDITWNKSKKQVYIDYIVILKEDSKDVKVYDTLLTIEDKKIDIKTWNKEEVVKYLKSNPIYYKKIYKSDIIFRNNEVEIYADLSMQNDKNELNNLINDAIDQVIYDFNHPPKYNRIQEFFRLNIIVNQSNWWVYLLIAVSMFLIIANR